MSMVAFPDNQDDSVDKGKRDENFCSPMSGKKWMCDFNSELRTLTKIFSLLIWFSFSFTSSFIS